MNEHGGLSLTPRDPAAVAAFVDGLYRLFLGRRADPDGLRHYVARIQSGTPLIETIGAFASSAEFRAKERREMIESLSDVGGAEDTAASGTALRSIREALDAFPLDYEALGEPGKSYLDRVRSGFLRRYCSGPVVLDVGFAGYDNPGRKTALPHAIGIDLNYPGYDGRTLPFDDGSVDTIFSSHCLEHILADHAVIQDWHRVLRVGGFVVCIVPSQALYEKKRFLPSRFNDDHKRMYTPASFVGSFEQALATNSYRVRHLAENDRGFDYSIGPDAHSVGAYEIELVIEKIEPPAWTLA